MAFSSSSYFLVSAILAITLVSVESGECLIRIWPQLQTCLMSLTTKSGRKIIGSRYRSEPFTCRLLNTNYITAESWLEYPIVFEPINRGRLTIWSGTSSLPGSGFKCYASKNGTGAILLDFANFADKLEWTYFGKCQQLSSISATE